MPFTLSGPLALSLWLTITPYVKQMQDDFLSAARKGDVASMKTLLAKGIDVNTKNPYGATALTFASTNGNAEAVKLLLAHKANVNVRDTFYGATPLTWATRGDHAQVVGLLFKAGATGPDSAVLAAVQQGKVEMVRAVLDNAKVKPETLNTALILTPKDKPALKELLTKAGAKPTKPAFELDEKTLASIVGMYENEGNTYRLTTEEGRLRFKFEDTTLFHLEARDAKTLMPIPNDSMILFNIKKEAEKVTALEMKALTTTQVYKRIDGTTAAATKPAPPVAPAAEPAHKPAKAGNWPGFRGDHGTGVADGQFPPTTWDAEKGINVLWKTPIPGLGHSCPVIWGDRLFVTTAISSDPKAALKPGQYGDVEPVNDNSVHRWKVYCLDKRSGKILWEHIACEGVPRVKRHTKGTHANATPTTDGKHLIVNFGSEGLYGYDLDGHLLWKRDLGTLDAGWFYNPDFQWGFASSPIIYKNLTIIQCDLGKGSFIAAYRVDNGEPVWRTERDEVPSWGTPALCETPTGTEVVTNASKFIRAYDPETGKELWRLGRNSEVTVGSPVFGHGLVFATGGYPPIRPVYAVRFGSRGDISLPSGKTESSAVAWSNNRNGTYMPTPIVYGPYLYTFNNGGQIFCYEAKTGKVVYQDRLRATGGFTASPVAADGRLYFTSEQGGVLVVKAGPKLEILARNPLGDVCLATPSIADGRIFFRTEHFVIATGQSDLTRR